MAFKSLLYLHEDDMTTTYKYQWPTYHLAVSKYMVW